MVCELRIQTNLRARKDTLARLIVDSLSHNYRYYSSAPLMNVVRRAQRQIRAKAWKLLQGPVAFGASLTNTEDPFTLTEISELPETEVWSFQDEKNHVYAFHAPEIYHSVQRLGPWNPCNRQKIPDADIERLESMMTKIPMKRAGKTGNVIFDAYSPLSNIFRRVGVHLDPTLFTHIQPFQIQQVANICRDLITISNARNLDKNYKDMTYREAHATFAADVLELLRSHSCFVQHIACIMLYAIFQTDEETHADMQFSLDFWRAVFMPLPNHDLRVEA
jgi:hypothetical protein